MRMPHNETLPSLSPSKLQRIGPCTVVRVLRANTVQIGAKSSPTPLQRLHLPAAICDLTGHFGDGKPIAPRTAFSFFESRSRKNVTFVLADIF